MVTFCIFVLLNLVFVLSFSFSCISKKKTSKESVSTPLPKTAPSLPNVPSSTAIKPIRSGTSLTVSPISPSAEQTKTAQTPQKVSTEEDFKFRMAVPSSSVDNMETDLRSSSHCIPNPLMRPDIQLRLLASTPQLKQNRRFTEETETPSSEKKEILLDKTQEDSRFVESEVTQNVTKTSEVSHNKGKFKGKTPAKKTSEVYLDRLMQPKVRQERKVNKKKNTSGSDYL